METTTAAQTETYPNARLGNGQAVHLTDAQGILCNRWGTVNGAWKAPRTTTDAATCKRCQKLAGE